MGKTASEIGHRRPEILPVPKLVVVGVVESGEVEAVDGV